MIAQFTDRVAGTAVYVNPTYVVTMRPEPEDPSHVTILKLSDGETIKVHGDHAEVAAKFAKPR
jgi:hypothetical protein